MPVANPLWLVAEEGLFINDSNQDKNQKRSSCRTDGFNLDFAATDLIDREA